MANIQIFYKLGHFSLYFNIKYTFKIMLADTLNDKNLQKVNYILQTQNGLSDFGLSDVLRIFTFSAGDSWRGIGMQRG